MTYLYFCPNCDAEKEDWHGILEEPEILCDSCKTIMKHKITGGEAFHLKGFGWSTVGSKDATQGHHKPVSQVEMAVPVAAGGSGIVSEEAKKGADSVKIATSI